MASDKIIDKFDTSYSIYFKLLPNKLLAIVKRRGFKHDAAIIEVEAPEFVSFYDKDNEPFKDGYAEILVVEVHHHFKNKGLYKAIIKRTIQELKKYNPEIKGLKSFYQNCFGDYRTHEANMFWQRFHENNSSEITNMSIIKADEDYFVELLK